MSEEVVGAPVLQVGDQEQGNAVAPEGLQEDEAALQDALKRLIKFAAYRVQDIGLRIPSASQQQLAKLLSSAGIGEVDTDIRVLLGTLVDRCDSDAFSVAVLVNQALNLALESPPSGAAPRTPQEIADYKAASRAKFEREERERKAKVAELTAAERRDRRLSMSMSKSKSHTRKSSGTMRRLSTMALPKKKLQQERGPLAGAPVRQGHVFLHINDVWKPFWVELSFGEIVYYLRMHQPAKGGRANRASSYSAASIPSTVPESNEASKEVESVDDLKSNFSDSLVRQGVIPLGGATVLSGPWRGESLVLELRYKHKGKKRATAMRALTPKDLEAWTLSLNASVAYVAAVQQTPPEDETESFYFQLEGERGWRKVNLRLLGESLNVLDKETGSLVITVPIVLASFKNGKPRPTKKHIITITAPMSACVLGCKSGDVLEHWLGELQKQQAQLMREAISYGDDVTDKQEGSEGAGEPSEQAARLKVVRSVPGNNVCADCEGPEPVWASINLGILLCIDCSGVHRSMGVHISKVRSLTMDDLDEEMLTCLETVGNVKSNAKYLAKLPVEWGIRLPPDAERTVRESFLKKKYQEKVWYSAEVDLADDKADGVEDDEDGPGEEDLSKLGEGMNEGEEEGEEKEEEETEEKEPLLQDPSSVMAGSTGHMSAIPAEANGESSQHRDSTPTPEQERHRRKGDDGSQGGEDEDIDDDDVI